MNDYSIEVKDQVTGLFGPVDPLVVTLDATVPKMTIATSDTNYLTSVDFRLTYNGRHSTDFIIDGCALGTPANYLVDPT